MYICSVKNTALIKGWQLFQEISLHVTQLINAVTAATVDDGGDDDDDDVITSQSHRSFTKVSIYFAGVPHGCACKGSPLLGSDVEYSIRNI